MGAETNAVIRDAGPNRTEDPATLITGMTPVLAGPSTASPWTKMSRWTSIVVGVEPLVSMMLPGPANRTHMRYAPSASVNLAPSATATIPYVPGCSVRPLPTGTVMF